MRGRSPEGGGDRNRARDRLGAEVPTVDPGAEVCVCGRGGGGGYGEERGEADENNKMSFLIR